LAAKVEFLLFLIHRSVLGVHNKTPHTLRCRFLLLDAKLSKACGALWQGKQTDQIAWIYQF
jgi:hypothetical protein